jgi:hypothetical protein
LIRHGAIAPITQFQESTVNRFIAFAMGCAALCIACLTILNPSTVEAQSGSTQPAMQCVQMRDNTIGHAAYNICSHDIKITLSNANGTLAPGRLHTGGYMTIMPVTLPYKVAACVSPGIPSRPGSVQWAGYNDQNFDCVIE